MLRRIGSELFFAALFCAGAFASYKALSFLPHPDSYEHQLALQLPVDSLRSIGMGVEGLCAIALGIFGLVLCFEWYHMERRIRWLPRLWLIIPFACLVIGEIGGWLIWKEVADDLGSIPHPDRCLR